MWREQLNSPGTGVPVRVPQPEDVGAWAFWRAHVQRPEPDWCSGPRRLKDAIGPRIGQPPDRERIPVRQGPLPVGLGTAAGVRC
jgi:hypothetical protein